jgi:SOS response associated peptidase (SRAP)
MFRDAVKRNRCLIPASGYYEWLPTPTGKQPYYYTTRDGAPLTFAGLWDEWQDTTTGAPLKSCTMIVTDANALAAKVHDRFAGDYIHTRNIAALTDSYRQMGKYADNCTTCRVFTASIVTRFCRNRRERYGNATTVRVYWPAKPLPPDPDQESAIARRGEAPWPILWSIC